MITPMSKIRLSEAHLARLLKHGKFYGDSEVAWPPAEADCDDRIPEALASSVFVEG
jgi:hypothetical protein